MTASAKAEWPPPAALLALSIVPLLAGTVRLVQLGTGAPVTPENARFVAAPLPVVLHLVSVTLYCVLGAFQFAPGFRRRHPNWHRAAGRVLVPCGLVGALSGLWMTQFYPPGSEPPASFDGPFVYAIRLLAGSAMALSLCLGLVAIRSHDVPRHRAWMLRAYALGIAAGTQVLTHLPWFMFPSIQGELARALFIAAGWVINLAVAEWLISRQRRQPSTTRVSAPDHRQHVGLQEALDQQHEADRRH
jgi:uncharacterized membrane protein